MWGRRRSWIVAAALLAASGCTVVNEPLNQLQKSFPGASEATYWPDSEGGETFVALAFSGGGMRASAFAYGVLTALDDTIGPDGRPISENVALISAASGGAVTAAWFGLKGPDGLDEFREAYERDFVDDLILNAGGQAFNPSEIIL